VTFGAENTAANDLEMPIERFGTDFARRNPRTGDSNAVAAFFWDFWWDGLKTSVTNEGQARLGESLSGGLVTGVLPMLSSHS
jgi:hypothetical protein